MADRPLRGRDRAQRRRRAGRPAGVIQLLDRHNRDGNAIAQRLEIPRLRLPKTVPASPFVVVPMVDQRWWRELALWWPQEHALVVAEAVGTAPLFALGRPLLRGDAADPRPMPPVQGRLTTRLAPPQQGELS